MTSLYCLAFAFRYRSASCEGVETKSRPSQKSGNLLPLAYFMGHSLRKPNLDNRT